MENYIAKLKAKPESTRKQIALWSSVAITLVIFLFWLAASTGLTSSATSSATTAVAEVVNRAGTPTQSLVASVGSLFGDLRDLVFTPKKITYSSVEVTAGK